MPQPTEHPAAAQQENLADLVTEADAVTEVLPTIGRCRELNDALRSHIRRLTERVEQRRDASMPRSRAWYEADNAVAETRSLLAHDMGAGLMSAALHVAALGRQARVLARIAGC